MFAPGMLLVVISGKYVIITHVKPVSCTFGYYKVCNPSNSSLSHINQNLSLSLSLCLIVLPIHISSSLSLSLCYRFIYAYICIYNNSSWYFFRAGLLFLFMHNLYIRTIVLQLVFVGGTDFLLIRNWSYYSCCWCCCW